MSTSSEVCYCLDNRSGRDNVPKKATKLDDLLYAG